MSCVTIAKAHPYASQITNLNNGSISFVLNENATDVSIIYGGNAATNDLGPLTKGVQTFSLTYNSISYTTYSIAVFNQGSGQITEISSDANTLNSIPNGNSIAVNSNPKTANFGRIYAGKRLGGGFYVRNADQSDAQGQGSTALTSGLDTYGGSTNLLNPGGSSFDTSRMYVGPLDDQVYVGSATTVANGFWLAAMSPTLSSFQLVLAGVDPTLPAGQNHGGTLGTPIVTGSIATGDLTVYCMDWDYAPGQCLQQWVIGSGPLPSSVTPTMLANSTEGQIQNWADAFINGTNYYTFLDRSSHTSPGFGGSLSVFHAATGTTAVWQSFNNSITPGYDYFANCADIRIAPNGQYIVGIDNATEYLIFCNLDANGIPIQNTLFTNVVGTATAGSYGSVAWDAAQNIYEITQGNGLMKVFSPGLTTLATTSNDTTATNGSFSLVFPSASVSASATIANASQNTAPNGTGGGPAIPGQFTITRSGSTTLPLTVYFMLEGTASNAVYTATAGASTFISTNGAGAYVTNSIIIAAGQSSTNITITPSTASVPRTTTTVTLNVFTNNAYSVPVGGAPVVSIQNTSPQALQVTGVGSLIAGTPTPSMYKGLTNDFASFVITRLGDTNNNGSTYVVTNFTYGGTAVAGVDYTLPGRTLNATAGVTPLTIGGGVTIAPGDTAVTATITPLPNGTNYTGNKSIVIGVAADGTVPYTVPTASTATLTLVDNAYPPAPVLFSDPLTNPVDGNNNDGSAIWSILFANTNFPVVPDYTAAFGYTLASDSVGPAPNGALTGLKLTVNKGGNGASAGVNAYPTNVSFSGNYAVRFNMNLVEGSSLALATEFAMYGINNSGLATNWVPFDDTVVVGGTTYPWGMDGITYLVDSEFSGTTLGDYMSVTGEGLGSQYGYVPLALGAVGSGNPGNANSGGRSGLNFAGASLKNSYDYPPGPYTAYPYQAYYVSGVPANRLATGPANAWADVEIKQVNNLVTMSINKTLILSYVNTNSFTNGTGPFSMSQAGTVMLGYNDPFASIGGTDAAVYYSNLRVVRLQPILITAIAPVGANYVINFTSSDGDDTPASFNLLTGTNAAAVDTLAGSATFGQIVSGASAGTFQVTTPKPAVPATFYRIQHK